MLVVGAVSPRDRDIIVDAIQGAGRALSLRFSAPASRNAADASVACLRDRTPWSCVAPMIRGKDQLVIVEVDSDRGGRAPMTVVTAHLLTAGAETESFASRDCSRDCGLRPRATSAAAVAPVPGGAAIGWAGRV